jgi:hypothetical protein
MTSSPISTRPSCKGSIPAATRNKVVFPHPDGPTRHTSSPAPIDKPAPSTAKVASNLWVILSSTRSFTLITVDSKGCRMARFERPEPIENDYQPQPDRAVRNPCPHHLRAAHPSQVHSHLPPSRTQTGAHPYRLKPNRYSQPAADRSGPRLSVPAHRADP